MKLRHGTLRPGTVIEVLDKGCIKVEAPGLFDAQDKESLPKVYPFYGQHANSFSSVRVNDEVWVMSFTDNPLQLHWIRKDDFAQVNGDLMNAQNVDIFMNRRTGKGGNAYLLYSDTTGWLMHLNGSTIGIDPNGNIILNAGKVGGKIQFQNADVEFGSHSVVFTDKLIDLLTKISGHMKSINKALDANTLTKAAAPSFKSMASDIDKSLRDLGSTSFKVN